MSLYALKHLFNTCECCKLHMPTNAIRKSKSDLIHLKFMLKKQMTNQITIMSYKDLDIQG